MYAAKKSLSRRTFLQGVGATIALPLLDSMVPAFAAIKDTAAAPINRLGVIYIPHGAVLSEWIPKTDGPNYEMSPTLKTLEPFRDKFSVITNMDNAPALLRAGEPQGGHANIMGAWLSGVHVKPTEGADVQAGITIDQIAARHFEKDTQLASLELGIEATHLSGSCDVGFSCAYLATVSWNTPTTPLTAENNPRAIFERLFGDNDTTDSRVRLQRIRKDRSILDSVSDKVASLQRKIGPGDQSKLSEYLEAVRDIERRIQKAEEQGIRDLPAMDRPNGAFPELYEDHVKLMFDLQVLAYQTDMTRVITFMMSKELCNRTYPQVDVPDPHHQLSHHQNNAENLVKLARVNVYHLEMLSYYLDRLQSTPDGDGSLLDHMMLMYGSGMGNSNAHAPKNLPILLAGGANGKLKGGTHIKTPDGTPLSNLYMSMLDKLDIPIETFGDATGRIEGLSGV
jgi:hypothetical protein